MKRIFFIFLVMYSSSVFAVINEQVRLKDIGKLEGWRDNHLVGFGIVTGLSGTGDSPRSKATRQSLTNFLLNFDIAVSEDQINSRNVAIVSITGILPPIAHEGDRVDVIVNSIGDARSLLGGSLMLSPLKGADGKVYALAQGALTIGGYKYDQNGNIALKNHTTVGIIPSGAQIEKAIYSTPIRQHGAFDFVLNEPDYVTANRVAEKINQSFKGAKAVVKDKSTINIEMSDSAPSVLAKFMASLESLQIQPDHKSRVVINERTGLVIAGGDVKISKVTIAHGDIRVAVQTNFLVSQPLVVGRSGNGVRTTVVPNTQINVKEDHGGVIEFPEATSVADLVVALNRTRTSTRDIIAILQGIKAAGAMHAELILQ